MRALAAYQAALRSGDVAAIAAATSSTAGGLDAAALGRELALDPAALGEARARVDRPIVGAQTIARVSLAGGAIVVLVLERDGVWRVADGGLAPAAQDTPERALATFFRAVEARAIPLVRRVIPRAAAGAWADDAALATHLDEQAERIARARRGVDARTRAMITADRAELAWGDGQRVTFVREEGVWKIVDLE
ncbi:hypothetical protein L6R52_25575 [Myxococcota bacterium]|nr:hypothetical protein [Myxococcota bacterium]